MQAKLDLTTTPSSEDVEAIVRGLNGHSAEMGRPTEWAPLHIRLTNDTGAPIGGLAGITAYEWLHIRLLFVPQELRGQGWGTKLVELAEEHARAKGCVGAWLDTFEHQAPRFYEKLGYSEFGRIEGHPPGSRRYFFQKRF